MSAAIALPTVLLVPSMGGSAAGDPIRVAAVKALPVATTSALEKKRVDTVPTPRIRWSRCFQFAECGVAALPLDYDAPRGPKVEVAVVRIKARKPAQRIGSLFLNPGGPGGSGIGAALAGPSFLSNSVLDRFDIVGFDPRGMGYSQNVRCFRTAGAQEKVLDLAGEVAFPITRQEETNYISFSRQFARACSTAGTPLSAAVSTAEVVRDMEVLRRAVGDRKLTYLGFSYGTAIASYAANMFPDRFRAIVADGVINPVNYVGTPKTQNVIMDDRLRTADGTYSALAELLRRCQQAGAPKCPFATGDPLKSFDLIAQRLKAKPLELTDPVTGPFTFRYQDLIAFTASSLYDTTGEEQTALMAILTDLLALSDPGTGRPAAAGSAAARRVIAAVAAQRAAREALLTPPGKATAYENDLDHYHGVLCTDAAHPRDAASWPALVARSDRRAPYFGRYWGTATQPCASATWTARDEDSYRGPFGKRTGAPVLYVGNAYDPATPQVDAETTSRLVPNSALITSRSWGHTAYGTSACVTRAVDTYLLTGRPVSKTLRCTGDWQPFTSPAAQAARRQVADVRRIVAADVATPASAPKQLPPVVGRMPLSE